MSEKGWLKLACYICWTAIAITVLSGGCQIKAKFEDPPVEESRAR